MAPQQEWSKLFPVLTAPEKWTFVSSALPMESQPVEDADYARWAATHLHRHPHQELLFCIEGETLEHFAGHIHRCQPGSVFLIDVNEDHANGYPRGSGDFTHLWVGGLGASAVANVYTQRGRRALEQRLAPVMLSQVECELLVRAWRAAKQPAPWQSREFLRTALFSAVFAIIFRALEEWHATPADNDASRRRRDVVLAVRRHIEAHLDEAGSLDSLAHVSGYSRFHFARLFREYSGQTVHDFVDDCRIHRVAELARRGALRKEMAAALGFSCPAAFSNWLRKNRSRLSL
jgi:AraC-like DNA-binding protein